MNDKKVNVAVIGAGTAGLSAIKEVYKVTPDCVPINGGSYGTTCARVGCMPSKGDLTSKAKNHTRKFELAPCDGLAFDCFS